MARALLVYNPAAGQWWSRPEPEVVRDALAREGIDAAVLVTRGQDHAAELVCEHLSPGIESVWACGGDGTVCQAATALVDTGVPLGILPVGTVNVIARECGVPGRWRRAARELARTRRTRPFRAWRVGRRAALLGIGVGYEARVIAAAEGAPKHWLGPAAVGASGVRELARYDFPPLRATGEDQHGRPFDLAATQVLASVTRVYAGRFVAAPDADPEDGCIDVIVSEGRSRVRLAAFWAGVEVPGTLHLRVPGVRTLRARRLRVAAEDGRAVEVHVNGDPVDATPVEVEPWGRVQVMALGR